MEIWRREQAARDVRKSKHIAEYYRAKQEVEDLMSNGASSMDVLRWAMRLKRYSRSPKRDA